MIEIKFDKNNNKSIAYDNNIQIGECDYIESQKDWNIMHTEVDKSYQGQGIAKKLVECIIENAKKYNKELTAECSYAKKVIESDKNKKI
ncbi:MAG: N-acetyltransferase [Clostridia bacterium]|nr:N-acetyltransferase [Clostridia bacterium]